MNLSRGHGLFVFHPGFDMTAVKKTQQNKKVTFSELSSAASVSSAVVMKAI